jgi:hypothetical protein
MIGAEIEGNPGAECDRNPWQQPAGTSFGMNPCAQRLEER